MSGRFTSLALGEGVEARREGCGKVNGWLWMGCGLGREAGGGDPCIGADALLRGRWIGFRGKTEMLMVRLGELDSGFEHTTTQRTP